MTDSVIVEEDAIIFTLYMRKLTLKDQVTFQGHTANSGIEPGYV